MEINNISNLSFSSKKKNIVKHDNKRGKWAAFGAMTAVQSGAMVASSLLAKGLTAPSKSLSKDEIEIVNGAAQQVLTELTNLSKKGTKIKNLNNLVNQTNMPDWLYAKFDTLFAISQGENAGFVRKIPNRSKPFFDDLGIKPNTVVINKDKLSLSTFHELGHAFNFNNSAFWKTIQKTRTPAMLLATLFAMFPVLTKDTKACDGHELSAKEKTVNTLRKASPFLATLSMLPMIAEESMATIRGNGWAKEVFKDAPELAKKVAKVNKFGLVSYALSAVIFGLSAFAAKKVKDSFDKKNESSLFKLTGKLEAHQG